MTEYYTWFPCTPLMQDEKSNLHRLPCLFVVVSYNHCPLEGFVTWSVNMRILICIWIFPLMLCLVFCADDEVGPLKAEAFCWSLESEALMRNGTAVTQQRTVENAGLFDSNLMIYQQAGLFGTWLGSKSSSRCRASCNEQFPLLGTSKYPNITKTLWLKKVSWKYHAMHSFLFKFRIVAHQKKKKNPLSKCNENTFLPRAFE